MDDVKNPFGLAKTTTAVANQESDRAVAEVQAALVIAKRFPRDPVVAMDRILAACTRQSLAEHGLYEYAKGGTNVTGPSIRLAEVLAQNWGNLSCGVVELSRSNGSSECLAYAWDLETNFCDRKTFTVRHVRDTKKGSYPIKDEREIYELIANMGSRRKRACLLAVIPGDVQEAAAQQCELTMKSSGNVDQDLVKSMIERYEKFGVTRDLIEKRIQRRIEAITPGLIVSLKKIYNSIKDGMSKPGDWFDFPEENSLAEKLKAAKEKQPEEAPPKSADLVRGIMAKDVPPNSAAVDEFYAEYDAPKEGDIPQ